MKTNGIYKHGRTKSFKKVSTKKRLELRNRFRVYFEKMGDRL